MLAALLPAEGLLRLRFSVNGKGHSWLPYLGTHTMLGAIPALIHPDPKDVLIIGLGSADTAWAAGCREETRRLIVYELGSPEVLLLRQLVEVIDQPPELRHFLQDPRVSIVIADGRNAMSLDERKYDVIEADALRPHSAFSGNLYSVEFFRLCASKLKPGGVMCSWSPTDRTYKTLCEVFPHVVEFGGGTILVGSDQPISIDLPLWQSRISTSVNPCFPIVASTLPSCPTSFKSSLCPS